MNLKIANSNNILIIDDEEYKNLSKHNTHFVEDSTRNVTLWSKVLKPIQQWLELF